MRCVRKRPLIVQLRLSFTLLPEVSCRICCSARPVSLCPWCCGNLPSGYRVGCTHPCQETLRAGSSRSASQCSGRPNGSIAAIAQGLRSATVSMSEARMERLSKLDVELDLRRFRVPVKRLIQPHRPNAVRPARLVGCIRSRNANSMESVQPH